MAQEDGGSVACPNTVLGCFLRRRSVLAACLAVALAVVLFHRPLLCAVAWPLVAARSIEQPKYVWVPGATDAYDVAEIYERCATLLREDPALRVVVVEREPRALMDAGVLPFPPEFVRRELLRRGVQSVEVVVVPGKARDDREATRLLGDWLAEQPDDRVVALCERLRTAELSGAIEAECSPQAAARLGIESATPEGVDEGNWWRSRQGVKMLGDAWLRRLFEIVRGPRDRPYRLPPNDYEAAFLDTIEVAP